MRFSKSIRQQVTVIACGAVSAFVFFLIAVPAQAEQSKTLRAQRVKGSTNPFSALSIFGKSFNTRRIVDVVSLDAEPSAPAQPQAPAAPPKQPHVEKAPSDQGTPGQEPHARAAPDISKLSYVSDDPADSVVLPPGQTPKVRVNPDAPGCFKALMAAKQSGDNEMARRYAEQCIAYQQNYFFEVREVAQLLGEALIAQDVINEDDWDGVTQLMEIELAHTRLETGSILKPTHDVAMQRIKPDPKSEVEIYYFFSLNCSWCRYMAPDVERLWRMAEGDPRVKMTVLTMDETPTEWTNEYRDYTGMSMPILNGAALAKEFNIRFVPAVVMVSPETNTAYLKTGQQSFIRLYEFMRRVQGLPATVTAKFKRLTEIPIGRAEDMKAGSKLAKISYREAKQGRPAAAAVRRQRKDPKELVGRF